MDRAPNLFPATMIENPRVRKRGDYSFRDTLTPVLSLRALSRAKRTRLIAMHESLKSSSIRKRLRLQSQLKYRFSSMGFRSMGHQDETKRVPSLHEHLAIRPSTRASCSVAFRGIGIHRLAVPFSLYARALKAGSPDDMRYLINMLERQRNRSLSIANIEKTQFRNFPTQLILSINTAFIEFSRHFIVSPLN